MKGIYKGFEGPNDNGFYTAIIEGQGLPTKFFGHGKKAPKVASGTTVEFDVDEKPHGNKVYYSVKGALKEVAGSPAAAVSGNTSNNYSNTNGKSGGSDSASIEAQVAIKEAAETFRSFFDVSNMTPSEVGASICKIAEPLVALMAKSRVVTAAPTPPKPKPKPVEEQSQDPDDSDIPY